MDWFMDTGIRVIAIIVVAIIIFFFCRWIIPSIMKRTITHRMAGETETEIQKRTDTIARVGRTTSDPAMLGYEMLRRRTRSRSAHRSNRLDRSIASISCLWVRKNLSELLPR